MMGKKGWEKKIVMMDGLRHCERTLSRKDGSRIKSCSMKCLAEVAWFRNLFLKDSIKLSIAKLLLNLEISWGEYLDFLLILKLENY